MRSLKSAEMNETGQNKYSKEFQVPAGFDEVLRNLTREILRSQPEDINKFGKPGRSERLACPWNSLAL